MLEDTKMEQRKQSIPKDTRPANRYGNLSKRLATKNESVQKVEVFLASQEINDTSRGNFLNNSAWFFSSFLYMNVYNFIIDDEIAEEGRWEIFDRKKSNTEALRPLIIKPKEHATLFKQKCQPQKLPRGSKGDSEKSKKLPGAQLKSKFPVTQESKDKKLIFSTHEKARDALASRSKKGKGKKLEKYLRPGAL